MGINIYSCTVSLLQEVFHISQIMTADKYPGIISTPIFTLEISGFPYFVVLALSRRAIAVHTVFPCLQYKGNKLISS